MPPGEIPAASSFTSKLVDGFLVFDSEDFEDSFHDLDGRFHEPPSIHQTKLEHPVVPWVVGLFQMDVLDVPESKFRQEGLQLRGDDFTLGFRTLVALKDVNFHLTFTVRQGIRFYSVDPMRLHRRVQGDVGEKSVSAFPL